MRIHRTTIAVALTLGAAALFINRPLAGQPPATAQPKVILIEGRREPGEASVSTKAMRYLPFDVPEGVTRITVHKEFDHGPDPTRKNTVDLGIFDPRGYGTGAPGFRGWQGGAPGDLVIAGAAEECSPHGVPGPIQAGRWYLAQYFLASSPAGLGYKYTVTLSYDGVKSPVRFPTPPVYKPGILRNTPGWYTGNLHVHSLHSDGGRPFSELVARNVAMGFDFVVSTEHNSPTAHFRFAEAARANPGHLLIAGTEFTSPSGHANILGQQPGYFFDFRMDAGDGKLPAVIREVHKQGGVFMVNHPFATCTSCTWLYPEAEWQEADAIEVWNGLWSPEDRKAVDLWDRLLKQGRFIYAYGGTDYHRGEDAMVPAARVYAKNLSRDAIMDGLKHGHVNLSESPSGPTLTLESLDGKQMPGDTAVAKRTENGQALFPIRVRVKGGEGKCLRLIWADGEYTVDIHGAEAAVTRDIIVTPTRNLSYIRAELADETGKVYALTNPIHLTAR